MVSETQELGTGVNPANALRKIGLKTENDEAAIMA
jgi:hypothetical protein